MNHGTVTAYVTHGCRCDECRRANTDYRRQARNDEQPEPPITTRQFQPRPFWFQFASCRPEYADRPLDQWVAQFFPTRGAHITPARDLCAECPAKEACADHGLHERHGVWGGTSERERRRLRRKLDQAHPAA